MSLENTLASYILKECKKLIERHNSRHNRIHLQVKRKEGRLDIPQNKTLPTNPEWRFDKKHNPFYVKRKVNSIAKSVAKKIEKRTYSPNTPYRLDIPKKGGGTRTISIYQVHDAAVSKLFYDRLVSKNKHRFSSFSYAYRNDRNVHFAIQDISVDLKDSDRMFVAEYDFAKFFDSIKHEYIYNQFDKNGFFIAPEERFIIESFLEKMGTKKGIPQGSSISLFLANLSCWVLDSGLEREGVKFSRYADDTVIWTPSYERICKAYEVINNFSKMTGVELNRKKSEGINLLVPPESEDGELSSKRSLSFLGYEISTTNVSIKDTSIEKIKSRICHILHSSLIQPIQHPPLRNVWIPANGRDRALMSAICQIRRYMYGGLRHERLINYVAGRSSKIFCKGIMSYYPLIDNRKQLKDLDGWMTTQILVHLKWRANILRRTHNLVVHPTFPYNIRSKSQLLKQSGDSRARRTDLYTIPSFLLIYDALRKALMEYGIERVIDPNRDGYNYRN